jgi:chromosome segregation ATPase
MTPEERFTKIENAIQALTENQAAQQIEIDKQNAGIRDLIVVSRTLLDSQQELTTQMREVTTQIREIAKKIAELREAQQSTEGKLHALIDTVDRIIGGRNGQA